MSMQPPPPPGAPPMAPPYATGPRYAGFWIRFGAYVIDIILVGAVVYGLLVALKPIQCIDAGDGTCLPGTTTVSATLYLISQGLPLLYFVILWSTGATVGQRVLKLRVVSADNGQAIGIGRAFLRYVGYIISEIPVFLGLIWAGFDSRKQGWHDKIASTVVIHT